MVLDHISNAPIYYSLSQRIAEGLALLADPAVRHAPAGRHEIRPDLLYYVVAEYTTKPAEQGMMEIHQKFLDIQYILNGQEYIYYSPLSYLRPTQPYDAKSDAALFAPRPTDTRLLLSADWFAIFWPNEPHAPAAAVVDPQPVRKIVVKVRME